MGIRVVDHEHYPEFAEFVNKSYVFNFGAAARIAKSANSYKEFVEARDNILQEYSDNPILCLDRKVIEAIWDKEWFAKVKETKNWTLVEASTIFIMSYFFGSILFYIYLKWIGFTISTEDYLAVDWVVFVIVFFLMLVGFLFEILMSYWINFLIEIGETGIGRD